MKFSSVGFFVHTHTVTCWLLHPARRWSAKRQPHTMKCKRNTNHMDDEVKSFQKMRCWTNTVLLLCHRQEHFELGEQAGAASSQCRHACLRTYPSDQAHVQSLVRAMKTMKFTGFAAFTKGECFHIGKGRGLIFEKNEI